MGKEQHGIPLPRTHPAMGDATDRLQTNSPATAHLARTSAVALYPAFALTGFGVALLGATLPVLLAHWSLSDRLGGTLFLCVFLGSSLGALLSRGTMTRSVARGTGLLVPTCAALGFASGRVVFPLCFLYGLGLGIAITSINRLQSERHADTRAREMNRLNLIWGLGAFCCPWLANEILRRTSVASLFLGLAAAFAVFTGWVLLLEVRLIPVTEAQAELSPRVRTTLPWIIALTTLLATGLESSTGAWIATYAERLRGGFGAPVTIVSVFWLGLLASRALHSTWLVRRFTERQLLRTASTIAACGCVVMVASWDRGTLLIAALLIGLGVGPVYPLLLAAVLPKVPGNTIFIMAGLGGATFPWLIGMISTQAGSLHAGMVLPAVAGVAMLASGSRVSSAVDAIGERASLHGNHKLH